MKTLVSPSTRRIGRPAHHPTTRRPARGAGFSLLELLMVIAIIGIIATMAVPALKPLMRSNAIDSANRQLRDDLAAARQRALVGRSTVYMVFVPPNDGQWKLMNHFADLDNPSLVPNTGDRIRFKTALTNLIGKQYVGYALLSERSLGDQPGQKTKRYLTEWRTLPEGVFVRPQEFVNQFKPDGTPANISWLTTPSTNRPFAFRKLPFPTSKSPEFLLPCLAFNAQGQLSYDLTGVPTATGETPRETIALTRGSIMIPRNGKTGDYLNAPPDVVDTQERNYTNNFDYVQVDWLTGRSRVLQPQISP